MFILSILTIIAFLYFDTRILKELDSALFKTHFQFSKGIRYLGSILLVLILVVGIKSGKWELVPSFIITFISPIYILRRFVFRRVLMKIRQDMFTDAKPSKQVLLFDTFSIIILWFVGEIFIVVTFKLFTKIFPHLNSELGGLVILAGLSSSLMVGLIYVFINRYPDLDFWSVVGLRRENRSFMKIVFIPMIIGIICAGVSSWILVSREVQPTTPLCLLQRTHPARCQNDRRPQSPSKRHPTEDQ